MTWSSLAASNKELYLAYLWLHLQSPIEEQGAIVRCVLAVPAQRRRREWPSAAVPLANTVPPMRAQFEGTELGIEAHGVFF